MFFALLRGRARTGSGHLREAVLDCASPIRGIPAPNDDVLQGPVRLQE